MGKCGGAFNDGLVDRRQAVVGLVIDEEVQLRTAFPPAGVVIKRRDLVKAQFLIVVRAYPFSGIDGAFFQRLVNLAAGNVLRHAAHALNHLAGKAADAEFQTLHIGNGFDFLAEPATHLRAGVTAGEIDDVVLLVKLAHQLHAVALEHPGRHLAAVQTERHGATECKCLVFAEEVIGRGVRHFNRAVLHAVNHTEGRHEFTGSVGGDDEFAATQFTDFFGKSFS